MRFSLLGPLVVADGAGCQVAVAGPRLRALLAALLLHANIPVPADDLAQMVWDGSPPPGGVTNLRSYVKRLRAAVDPGAARIATSGAGYVIRVEQPELDILEFEALCRDARAALRAWEWADASVAATRALGLWRAAPLLDVPADALRGEFVPRLEQLRLQVLEDRFDAGLRLGQHQELIPQLLEVTARHPLQERFHAQLMLALAGTGQRAQALGAYQQARRVLVDELGIEPGTELRDIHRQILAGDAPVRATGPARPAEAGPQRVTPRALPSAVRDFTGRSAELQSLTRLLDRSGEPGIVAIGGAAGVGKTALAVHAAHRLAGRFPDGQLFLDLHGHTKGYPPREPGEALGSLLQTLGVPAGQIPTVPEESGALYRQLLADTRTLILLDNAVDEAQVRPLLPGESGCLALVTSRSRLNGLDDAHVVTLDVLPEADAVTLLRTVTGPTHAAADDPDLAEIAGLCGRLPHALRIAGALLRHRPAWTPGYLAGLLRDERERLAALADGGHDLRAVFDLSYAALDEPEQRLFRRLELALGLKLDTFAAAALLDTDPDATTELLEDPGGVLSAEVGVEPGPGPRDLHPRILSAYPALPALAPGQSSMPTQPVMVPRQLPAAPRRFTGRNRELARLNATLEERYEPGGTLVISAIGGAGGIGKTWLALHWAHQHADRFPDGQLYVNLHGFDPSGEPMPPGTAVRGFLDALGVTPAAIPDDLDAQAGLFRSLLAGKRMLIVADNARDTTQVIPLLPGSPTCTVLVTSRQRLTGLISAHGAHALDLDVLPDDEARQLLARHLGDPRVTAEPDAVAELLACCAGLPLAISIVAARALTHPGLPLAALAEELRDAEARLDALETKDLPASLRATLSWSYGALSLEAARVLGLLALAPGPDISTPAAASLTAMPSRRLGAVLRELEHVSLVQQRAPGRYRIHDLVRLYAAEQASRDQAEDDRTAALCRLVDFYLHTAYAGDRLLAPARTPIILDKPTTGHLRWPPSDTAGALTWFGDEHACLLATQHLAAALGWHQPTWQLAWTLNTYHQRRGLAHDQLTTWRLALSSARRMSNQSAQLLAHRWIGIACAQTGDGTGALDHLQRALALAAQSGDVTQQALGHHHLARAWEHQGDELQALTHAKHALRLIRTVDNPVLNAQALNATGWYHARLGNYVEARTACLAALALYREHRHLDGQGNTLDSLGYIAYHTNDHVQAVGYYHQALTVARERCNAHLEADILDNIAKAYLALHQSGLARDTWKQALALYRLQQRFTDAARVQAELSTCGARECDSAG